MMKTNRLFSGTLFALALIALKTAHAEDKEVALACKYKEGGVARYETVLKGSVGGTDFLIKNGVKRTIKEVKASGDVVLLREEEPGKIKLGEGAETDTNPDPPATQIRDKRNRLIDNKADPPAQAVMTPEVQHLLWALEETLLPEKAVKEGDTWETMIDNPAVKDKKVTVKGKYLGTEKVGDVELWKIKQTAEAAVNADGGKLTYETTAWLNPMDGQLQKLEAKLTDVPLTFGAATWEMTMKRLAAPNVNAEEKAVELAQKVTKDSISRYETSIKATVGGMEILVTSKTKHTVKDVKANGDVVSEQVAEEVKVKVAEMPEMDQPGTPPVTETRDKRGKFVDLKAEPNPVFTPEVQQLMAALNDIIFPDKPVKKEDAWETVIDNPAVKDKKVTVKGKYLGTEKVGDVELWKIKQTAEAAVNADGGKLTCEIIAWLNPMDGKTHKAEAKLTGIPFMGAEMSWQSTTKLIKPDKEK